MPDFDNRQAASEGWAIWECLGDGAPFKLCRDDETEMFADDLAAWGYVVAKAEEGSEYHMRALAFLREHSPAEFQAIVNE